ncbi:MAG: hypothetical protein JWN04_3608 [Myxococcaceae bacterium]|nr:hypothetical protein [Myxococcaceae bacterium]
MRARADEIPNCVVEASDEEVTRRLDWIEARMGKGTYGAVAWWGGLLAFAAAEGTYGWVKYAQASDRLDRDVWFTTGLGSTLWIAQLLLFPLSPAYAVRRVRQLPQQTAGERRVSLAKAERILRDAAQDEREGLHWAEHALDLAWAVGSSAYILGRSWGHEPKRRVLRETGIEFALTVAFSEATILSTPRQAIRDLENYEGQACVREHVGAVPSTARQPVHTVPGRFQLGVTGLGWTLQF